MCLEPLQPARSLLSNSGQLKQSLSSLDVGACICLRLVGKGSVGSPKVDQRLHWLQLMRLQHIDLGGGEDEVAETAVHALFEIEMIERINEMGPVKVSVDTEHLAEDGLADIDKLGREAATLSNPVTGTSKLGERCVQSCRSCGDGGVGSRSVETARCVGCAGYLGATSVVGI